MAEIDDANEKMVKKINAIRICIAWLMSLFVHGITL